MDIETYNVLLKQKADAQSELLEINKESFDLKIRKAKAERVVDQVDWEIHKMRNKIADHTESVAKVSWKPSAITITEKDVTGH